MCGDVQVTKRSRTLNSNTHRRRIMPSTSGSQSTNMLRVAVIGAGAAGLCAARHLASNPRMFEPRVFEKAKEIGGTWVYTEETGTDKYGEIIHSSMYWDLKTNLPKEVMAFPDFPFDKSLPSFIKHQDVLKYLNDYSEKYDLTKFINFNTAVDYVKPVHQDGQEKVLWDVGFRDVRKQSKELTIEQYDAVLVCNGHYAIPKIPDLLGIDDFQGQIMHSHNYRHPQVFKDKSVVLLGAGSSGKDIAVNICEFAKKVMLSHNKAQMICQLPSNMTEKSGIDHLTEKEVVFTDGTSEPTDVLLLCTGYNYNFPFLTPECNVKLEDHRISPLYKHLIHTQYPSLAFIGICSTICPFPQFDCQVKFTVAVLNGSLKLPSQEEMEEDARKDYEWRRNTLGYPNRYAHRMGTLQWAYNDDLSEIAKFQAIPRSVSQLYDAVHEVRRTDLMHYKKMNYILTGKDSWEAANP
ncbi:uncharacterized protein [Ptychodera flava]|uniref:uncharacterized protein isoform X2 n=1 Tax=Ptychodera flava TaxID=63121 RepID=UPI003969CAF6